MGDNNSLLLLLRLVHIVVGVLWVGTTIFLATFLVPTIKAIGPAGGAVMQELVQRRKLSLYLSIAGPLVLLSGIALYGLADEASGGAFRRSHNGMTFGVGGALALIGGLIGMFYSGPQARRLGEMSQAIRERGTPPTPEEGATLGAMQARLGGIQRVVAVLLLLATIAMSVARYV